MAQLYSLIPNPSNPRQAKLQLNLHAGQFRAYTSEARFILVLAGTQSGKTCMAPHWLYREIQKRGPGDYLVATPTYKLLSLKALPEFLNLFEKTLRLGDWRPSQSRFIFNERGMKATWPSLPTDAAVNVLFGHAADPDSLESATAKAAWLDEAGQKSFKFGSWEAILRRLSISQGRILITTTPYTLGWLKSEVFDRARAGDKRYEVVNFKSIMNPTFPRQEYERARDTMPGWRFRMMYDGQFEFPAGMIYDCWSDDFHLVPVEYAPEPNWERYVGLDFGGVNTAAVFLAKIPGTDRYMVYDEYHAGSRTAAEHAAEIIKRVPDQPMKCIGGASSEDQWRLEFTRARLPVVAPDQFDVEVGISRVYSLLKEKRLIVRRNCSRLIDQLMSYARETDEFGNPTEKIEDKETYHLADALRYIGGWLAKPRAAFDLR